MNTIVELSTADGKQFTMSEYAYVDVDAGHGSGAPVLGQLNSIVFALRASRCDAMRIAIVRNVPLAAAAMPPRARIGAHQGAHSAKSCSPGLLLRFHANGVLTTTGSCPPAGVSVANVPIEGADSNTPDRSFE
jgi:hypothetical protein